MTLANGQSPSHGPPIDGDYSTLLESIHDLRYIILSRRNDELPVNRLPVEIFTLICNLSFPFDPELVHSDNRDTLYVMKLTHVCRRWRSVLISSPAFWTNFHVVKHSPKFVAECLQRSKTLPIHVSLDWDGGDPDYVHPSPTASDDGSVAGDSSLVGVDEDGLDRTSSSDHENSCGTPSHGTLSIYSDHRDGDYSWTAYLEEARCYYHLMQESHRIAALDIRLSTHEADHDEEENPLGCGLLLYPLPALQTLKLRCSKGGRSLIPKAILDEHITSIKNLLLQDVPPIQIFNLSLNITSLDLRATDYGAAIDTGSFVRFLGRNQTLQSLTLRGYHLPPAPEPITPAILDNLRRLDFSGKSTAFLRHLSGPPLGPQCLFNMERERRNLYLTAENSAARATTSISGYLTSEDPDSDELISVISEAFGLGWEEATRVTVVVHVGGWKREFVDQFLARLNKLDDLLVDSRHDQVYPWFDSLGASKERCPKLKRIRLGIAPESLLGAFKSVRRLVKRRAEDGIPLEAVDHIGLSPFAVGIWNDLYDQWNIKDYLKAGG